MNFNIFYHFCQATNLHHEKLKCYTNPLKNRHHINKTFSSRKRAKAVVAYSLPYSHHLLMDGVSIAIFVDCGCLKDAFWCKKIKGAPNSEEEKMYLTGSYAKHAWKSTLMNPSCCTQLWKTNYWKIGTVKGQGVQQPMAMYPPSFTNLLQWVFWGDCCMTPCWLMVWVNKQCTILYMWYSQRSQWELRNIF